ncbi:MAG: hypothetical protein DRP85_01895, partial [Candidatus Makaraimicrobium thalassicum]
MSTDSNGNLNNNDFLHPISFIEVRSNPRKRKWLKVISFFVAFVFFFQQIGYSWDYSYLSPAPVSGAPGAAHETLVPGEDEAEVTNYDLLSYRRRQSGVGGLFATSREQEQTGTYAPQYLKRQQRRHEEIMRQKQATEEDLKLRINRKRNKEFEEDLPLKKKKSAGGRGGIYYTLEDYDESGNPRQLNAYIYEGGRATKRMIELISYDVSGLDTGIWTATAKEIEPEEGDKFIGSYRPLANRDALTDDRIIRKTVYFGGKGDERVDYVLADYDEVGVPGEVTIHDYDSEGNGAQDNLDETRTYNISNLDIDFESAGWRTRLTEDRLIRKVVYEGAKEDERIAYALDTYFIDDDNFDENNPNKITIYDYDKDDSDGLDEVRAYHITDLAEENWLEEDAARLESIMVYEGEKDEEKIEYVFSLYFEDGEEYTPWERKDYFYEGDLLERTETYDISELDAGQKPLKGTGELEEEAFFTGEKNHERIDYSYSLYGEDAIPQLRTAYIYDGRALQTVETYDIAGVPLDSRACLQELTLYEGKAGEERLLRTTSYYPEGAVLKETRQTYQQNERGIYYVSHTLESTYSLGGAEIERIETNNDLHYMDLYGTERDDPNGNIRNQNIQTYCTVQGIERLDMEEDVVYSNYTARRQPRLESRRTYTYDENNEKVAIEYREIINHMFNSKGSVTRQTIHNYRIDDEGADIYDNTQEVENYKFDYYGNVLDRSEKVWLDREDRSDPQLRYYRIAHNDYDNRLAQRRGIASFTGSTRYNSLEESEENEIDRTETTIAEFDNRGYAVRQTTDTYVVDRLTYPSDPVEKLTERREVLNLEIDARGDARSQHVTVFRTDQNGNFITDGDGIRIPATYQVSTNREFDSRHNVTNQMTLTFDREDENERVLLDVQEIRSIGYHASGVARRQIIATYADAEKTDLLDVKVIANTAVSSSGDIGKSVITRYGSAAIVDEGEGIITYEDPIDEQIITNQEFDIRGNVLRQTLLRKYWDEDAGEGGGAFVFSESREITNESFDFHDRTARSVILNYSDEAFEELLDRQEIFYDEYDQYGNSLRQRMDTYVPDEITAELELLDHKVVENVYGDPVAQRRGNATETTVNRYDMLGEENETIDHLIDRIYTITTEFDNRGFAVWQTTDIHVVDRRDEANPVERRVLQRISHNIDINNRGDAREQEITVYTTDDDGDFILDPDTGERVVTTFQVFTNREFDSTHNIENQMIFTYNEEGGVLLDVQEIRSEFFHSSGVALRQTIATYTDAIKTELLDVKVVENRDISSSGNIGTSVITKYGDWTIEEGGAGEIVITQGSEIDRQTIVTEKGDFDLRGNALAQTVLREYWDEDAGEGAGAFVFSEAQEIANESFDFHDRAAKSVILNYSDEAFAELLDRQEIFYDEYDQYGNALEQRINTYVPDETTAELALLDHKVIVNDYGNPVAQRRGNATYTEVTRYDSLDETGKIDRTVTVTAIEDFDSRGYATKQTSSVYVMDRSDEATPVERLTSERITENININNRGDAAEQRVTVYLTDDNGDFIMDETTGERLVTTYQVFTNRNFDSAHNVKNQMIFTYSEEEGILLDVQEIRSGSFHSSGVARKQIIATYADATKEHLLDVKEITNLEINSRGNVKRSEIVKYSGRAETDIDGGAITPEGMIDRQVIEVVRLDGSLGSAFDLRGNATEQKISKYYWEDGSWRLGEAQTIQNFGYDIHDRVSRSIVRNYGQEDLTEFRDMQNITYLEYDRFGNSLEQTIDTYTTEDIDPANILNHKRITSSFQGTIDIQLADGTVITDQPAVIAARRGNAIVSTVRQYSGDTVTSGDVTTFIEDMTTLVDETTTTTSLYDYRGYAVDQVSDTWVVDRLTAPDNPQLKLATRRETHNGEIDARGDAYTQAVTTWMTDATGAEASLEVMNYQVMTNREFNSDHNILNQNIVTLDEEGGLVLDVQEIRSEGPFKAGVARRQIIATYMDEAKTQLLDVKEVTNLEIDSQGNVARSEILKYSGRALADTSGGAITPEGIIDRQIIEVVRLDGSLDSAFDLRGNATEQKITRYYREDGSWSLSEAQTIQNFGYDIHDRVSSSIVRNYGQEDLTGFRDMQNITYLEYDRFGNSLEQTIDTYTTEDIDLANILNHKRITSSFEGTIDIRLADGTVITDQPAAIAARRGNAIVSTVSQYSGDTVTSGDVTTFIEDMTTLVDETVTTTSLYDYRGYAVDQVSDTLVVDRLTDPDNPQLKLATRRETHNGDIDARGDAYTQTVTTWMTDATGAEASLEVTNYQVMTNREYDSEHNILNQNIVTMDEAGGLVLDVQEIRSEGPYKGGVARKQIIATYMDEAKTQLLDVKEITNLEIDSQGNVARSEIIKYSGRAPADISGGAITPEDIIDRQVIEVLRLDGSLGSAFDLRGNATEQKITRYYREDGSWSLMEAQTIQNFGYDIHDRTSSSIVRNY